MVVKGKLRRNEMHFEVQRSTRANIWRDRTIYSRKAKHKSNYAD